MNKAGRPRDWSVVHSPAYFGGSPSWRYLKMAVAYRVIRRFFADKRKVLVSYNSALNKPDYKFKGFVNQMLYDDMADQILRLGGFKDDRLKQQEESRQ